MGIKVRRYSYAISPFVLLALLVVAASVRTPPVGAGEQGAAQTPTGGLQLTATPIPSDGVISVGEPLLMKIDWKNRSDQQIEWLTTSSAGGIMGSSAPTTYLEVRDGEGKVLSALSRPTDCSPDGVRSITRLEPGETKSRVVIVSGLHRFEKPGEYTVHIEQLGTTEGLPVLADASVPVTVVPFDASRLEARCEELFKPIRTGTWPGTDIDIGIRARALYLVRNDVVLPYLEWLARELRDHHACEAMLRMNTERSIGMVTELKARGDEVGEAARKGEKAFAAPHDLLWDTAILY